MKDIKAGDRVYVECKVTAPMGAEHWKLEIEKNDYRDERFITMREDTMISIPEKEEKCTDPKGAHVGGWCCHKPEKEEKSYKMCGCVAMADASKWPAENVITKLPCREHAKEEKAAQKWEYARCSDHPDNLSNMGKKGWKVVLSHFAGTADVLMERPIS